MQQRIYGADHHILAGTLEQIGWLAFREGEFEAALKSFERALEILEAAFEDSDPRVARARINVAWALLRLGETSTARQLYAANVDPEVLRIEGGTAGAGRSYWNLGCMAALLGEHAEAVEWLKRAVEAGVDPALLTQDGDLDGLRGVPEFERLLIEARAAE